MESSNLWSDIDSRLGETFMMIPLKVFATLLVMTIADLLQLLPVRGKFIFYEKDRVKHLLGLQLWHLFKYSELAEFVRQNDKRFTDLCNKIRVRNNDDDVENLLQTRFICESVEKCPKDALQMYGENEPAMKRK